MKHQKQFSQKIYSISEDFVDRSKIAKIEVQTIHLFEREFSSKWPEQFTLRIALSKKVQNVCSD